MSTHDSFDSKVTKVIDELGIPTSRQQMLRQELKTEFSSKPSASYEDIKKRARELVTKSK